MGERMLRYDVESSPQTYARVGGALYLMLIGLGGVGLFARDTLIVASDAAATAVTLRPTSRCGGSVLPPSSSH